MACRNCTSRVLRVFLHDSTIPPPILRPHFHPRLVIPPPEYIRLSTHFSGRRHQSSLSGESQATVPSDDDYIPFGQPVTNGALPGQHQDENFSGYMGRPPPPPPPPPPPTLVDSYEPAVEIIGHPDPEPTQLTSIHREAEIRRKIEELWDEEQSNAYLSMRETGLPIVSKPTGIIPPELAVIREGVCQELEAEDSSYRAQYGARAKLNAPRKPGGARWRLPPVKQKKGKRKEEHASLQEPLDGDQDGWRARPNRTRTMEEGEDGGGQYSRGGIIAGSEMAFPPEEQFPPEIRGEGKMRLPPISEFATGRSFRAKEEEGDWGGGGAWASEGGQLRPAKKSKDKKLGAGKVRELRGAVEPRGEKPGARKARESQKVWGPSEEGERGPKPIRKSRSLDRWEPKRTETSDDAWQEKGPESLREEKRLRKKWELPSVNEVQQVLKRAVPAPRSKLEHFIANTPRGKIESWKIQKAALMRKFAGAGWNPLKKLSPTAQDWIRDIHKKVPEFTTERLSGIFKVSPEAIRRILKANWCPTPDEAQEREKRWAGRREKIWEKWMDEGLVQTKGMRKEFQQKKEEGRRKWNEEKDAKWDKYREKMEARQLESERLRQRAEGTWLPDDRHFIADGARGPSQMQDALEQHYDIPRPREYKGRGRGRPRLGATEMQPRASGARQQGDWHFTPVPESKPPQNYRLRRI